MITQAVTVPVALAAVVMEAAAVVVAVVEMEAFWVVPAAAEG
jgi:hypothetical protein